MPGARRAHVGDRVHRSVRGVRGRERTEVLERDREREVDVEAARRRAHARATRSAAGPTPGSTSVVQYQFAVNRTTSAPSLRADDRRALRGDRSGRQLAGDERRGLPRGARPRRCTSTRRRVGPRPRRAARAAARTRRGGTTTARVVRRATGCPNPICSNSRCGESRRDRFGELVDLDRLDAALQRQQRERKRVGDEPRAAPGRVDRRAARSRTRRATRVAIVVAEALPAGEELAARRDDVRARLEQRDDVVEVERAWHVQHAVGARARGSRPGRSVAATPTGSSPHRTPGVDAVLRRGRRPARRRARAPGGGSPRAARGCRCCPSPTGRPGSAVVHAHESPARRASCARGTRRARPRPSRARSPTACSRRTARRARSTGRR